MNFASKLDIKHTLILSGLIHLFMVSPASKFIFNASLVPEPKMDLPEIEFEFFQAAPKEEKHVFIPKNFQDTPLAKDAPLLPEPDSQTPPDSHSLTSQKIESLPPLMEEAFNDDPMPSETLPPSLEEQDAVKTTEEKTSDSLISEVELEKQEEDKKTAWDYSNRIRTLVENNLQFPENLKNQNIEDVVIVEITLNRAGKLAPGSLKIAEGCASRYPEINTLAIEFIYRASEFFPPIPKNYSKNEVTFTLPIRFGGPSTEQGPLGPPSADR